MSALSFTKNISVTPESRKSPMDWSALQTSAGDAREVLDVCDSLGISPSSLHPKQKQDFQASGSRLAEQTRFLHYEQLRKAKIDLVQQELTRRKLLQSPKRLVPVLPLSGVGMWRQRFNLVCSRIETTKRVLDNKSRMKSRQREHVEGKIRATSAKERKVMEERKAQQLVRKESAEKRQKHREKVLQTIRMAQKAHEVSGLSQSPRSERSCFSAGATLRTSVSMRRACQDEELSDVGERLSRIQLRIERGAERARAKKEAVSLSARAKVERVGSLSQKRREAEKIEVQSKKERIQRLQQSSERHLKNKEVFIRSSVERLNTVSRSKAHQVRTRRLVKAAESRILEESYASREAQKTEQLDRLKQEKMQNSLEKARKKELRRGDVQEAKMLLTSQRLAEKTRILNRHQKADETVSSIREVKSQIQVLHDRAAVLLQLERERQLQQDIRSERSLACSAFAGEHRDLR